LSAAIAEVPKTKKASSDPRPLYESAAPTPLHAMPSVPPVLYAPSQSTVYEIPVDLIVRSETNRQPELDDDFVESISRGVDSPVLVRAIKATQEHVAALKEEWRRIDSPDVVVGQTIYKLVYGERRWAASKKAGKKTIPAIVRELTETQALEIQVRENEQRKDYNALDRAAAYAHLRAQYMKDHHGEKGFTEEKCCALIAEACKNDKIKGRTVQQIIALGKLTPDCQAALRKGEMEQSHAYEFSRLSVQDQAELLLWLRQQTHHSQGDVPSVRRLKLEIKNMDIRADEKRRQETLFKPPQPGTSTTKVPTVDEVALPGSKSIMKEYEPAKSGAQTLAPKMPTKGYLQREAKQREQEAKAQRDRQHNARIDKEYKSALFSALAKKSHVCSRLLTHIIPGLLFELWEQNDIPLEVFAQELLGWPAPPNGSYGYGDIRAHAKKHSRKYSGNLLAALLITIHLPQPEAEQLAKYFGVDPKKLRQKAAAAVKQEDADAKKKAKNQGPRAGVPA
jgi:ParB/RepB/Spo0J family partition protein